MLLVFSPADALYHINYPYYKDLTELHYQTRLKSTGQVIFKENVRIFTLRSSGRNFLLTSAESSGASAPGEEFARKTLSYYIMDGDTLTAYSHRAETLGPEKKYQFFELDYDWEDKVATFVSGNHFRESRKTIQLSDNIIFARDTTVLFPALITRQIKETTLKIITASGRTFNLKARLSYTPEEFIISGKKVVCYRVDLGPELDILFFLPKVTFWYLSQPPYNFVRYEGPLGGPFSPTVIQESVPE
jgi:hypothetical protein